MYQTEIVNQLYRNSTVFLNDAISHLNKGMESYKDMVLAVVDIQMSLELAIKVRVAQDFGIRTILEKIHKDTPIEDTPIEEIIQKYESNSLRVKEFDALKNFLRSKRYDYQRLQDEYTYMEKFQKYRNKLVHFNYNFSETERNEIEDDIIHILVYILHALLSSDLSTEEYREFIFDYIDTEEYRKLLRNPKYRTELHEVIDDEYGESYSCPICDSGLLTPTMKCLGCINDFNDRTAFGFVQCKYCGKETVIFDNLNISDNDMLRGLCVSCGEDTTVYKCKRCGNVINLELFDFEDCTIDHCAVYDEPVK